MARGKDGGRPDRDGRPTWTPDEMMDAAGVPAADGARFKVMYQLLSAHIVALTEAAVALNGGEPVRVPVARIKAILAMDADSPDLISGLTVPDGDDYLFSIERDADAIRAKIAQDQRRQALHRMGPNRN